METHEIFAAGLALPPVLDLIAASSLLEAFLTRRGQALSVDGAAVERVGGQCLQVMLAARAAWAADDQELLLENCSEDFLGTIDLLGVTVETLSYRKEFIA